MLERIKSIFQSMEPEDQYAFDLRTYRNRRFPVIIVAALVLVFELWMLISTLTMPGGINSSASRPTYFLLYISLFSLTLFCLALLIGLKARIEKNPKIFLALCVFYAFFICFWSAYLSAYSHRNSADISVFLYVCLAVAILIPLKPWQAIALYSSSWAFFLLVLSWYLGPEVDPFASQLNSAFTAILSMFIAIVLQRMYMNDYFNTKTILEQNHQIQSMNARLQAMVTVDELTQIHNRRFMERDFPQLLAQARDEAHPVSLMMVDIDHFKQYNDHYGHQAGDECLRQVSSRIAAKLPQENAYFVRYGGEEFLALLTGLESDEARELAERIREDIAAARIEHKGSSLGIVTVSIGVCCSRRDGQATLSQLVHYADSAMYDAKAAGRNQVVCFRFTGTDESM